MKYTTPRIVRMMELAARPEGVLSGEVDKETGDVTKNARRLQAAGWITELRMTRHGRYLVTRIFTTPELLQAWRAEHQLRGPGRPKPSPSLVIPAGYGKAWWSSAGPGEPGHVPPVVTPQTKFTVCPGFTGDPRYTNTHPQ